VHEHWNNASDKEYTRNLGTGDGIELVAVPAVGIDDDDVPVGTVPRAFALSQNYPNPFNPQTVIRYDVPEKTGGSPLVTLSIYNVHGQLVRTLVHEEKTPGMYRAAWDGRSESGEPVGSGIYLYRLTAGDFTSTRKMVLLR
jgi:hypothetical protein